MLIICFQFIILLPTFLVYKWNCMQFWDNAIPRFITSAENSRFWACNKNRINMIHGCNESMNDDDSKLIINVSQILSFCRIGFFLKKSILICNLITLKLIHILDLTFLPRWKIWDWKYISKNLMKIWQGLTRNLFFWFNPFSDFWNIFLAFLNCQLFRKSLNFSTYKIQDKK